MNDTSHGEIDTETPVNPYSLLEAVNRSSGGASAAWLIYLALMSYLLITIAGIGHKDLLLNSDIVLPVLQVKIELTRFFLFAPILLVLIHVGLISQLVLLARKTLEFAAAIRMLETSEQRTHPLRLELDNFFFVQAIAGPERSRIVGFFLHGMSWLTLVVMPVILLLYMQLVFLPYHDVAITWAHRVVLLADIALLVFIGVFLWRLETSFFRRLPAHEPASSRRLAVHGPPAGRRGSLLALPSPPSPARPSRALRQANARGGGYILGYAVPGLGAAQEASLFGLFHRNLIVTDADLVVDKDVTPGEPSINLRGRDLRFAKLDRTDLHQADMTGANLEGASLVGADLRGVWLGCGDLGELLLTNSRGAARCASARGANFSKARLAEAKMAGIDLRGGKLEEAQLDGAQLAHALMSGASFANAKLDRADLTGAWLHGANFLLASLQGADLAGAKLLMSDFTSAAMQGANLSLAGLEGAVLRDAELEGASLRMATPARCRHDGRQDAGQRAGGRAGLAHHAARRRDRGLLRHEPDRRAAPERGRADRARSVDGVHRGWGAQGAARRQPGGAHRPRPERELGHLARSAAVAGPRQVQRRGGDRRRLQDPPHRIPRQAHVPVAPCQRRGGDRHCPARHGPGLQGRHALDLRQAAQPGLSRRPPP